MHVQDVRKTNHGDTWQCAARSTSLFPKWQVYPHILYNRLRRGITWRDDCGPCHRTVVIVWLSKRIMSRNLAHSIASKYLLGKAKNTICVVRDHLFICWNCVTSARKIWYKFISVVTGFPWLAKRLHAYHLGKSSPGQCSGNEALTRLSTSKGFHGGDNSMLFPQWQVDRTDASHVDIDKDEVSNDNHDDEP